MHLSSKSTVFLSAPEQALQVMVLEMGLGAHIHQKAGKKLSEVPALQYPKFDCISLSLTHTHTVRVLRRKGDG